MEAVRPLHTAARRTAARAPAALLEAVIILRERVQVAIHLAAAQVTLPAAVQVTLPAVLEIQETDMICRKAGKAFPIMLKELIPICTTACRTSMRRQSRTVGNDDGVTVFDRSPCDLEEKNKERYLLLFGCGPLVIGFLYYELLCPDVFFVRCINHLLGYSFQRLTIPPEFKANCLWRLTRNHLADFLWAQSLAAAMFYLGSLRRRKILITFALSATIATLMELIQISPYILLTYDSFDIVAQLLGVFSALIAWHIFIRKKKGFIHERR